MKNLFLNYVANENSSKWNNMISRLTPLYSRNNDIRSEFERDYTRIIHCSAYRRLKHKTQVFFSPKNDHICTRIEHVTHVESISYTIAKYLGLNTELTRAIASSHDFGHSPFGHEGEKVLSNISKRDLGVSFWHEKNGLFLVDNIELLEDNNKKKCNLNLTYAVRDGIISHCGEIDENSLKPRDEYIELDKYSFPNEFSPYTWEACVVKIADKISYIGRDIEDAISLGLLDSHLEELYDMLNLNSSDKKINNTFIINYLVSDLCNNSTPEKGLCFSEEAFDLLNKIKKFNYKYIYMTDKLAYSTRYFNVVINEIYNLLKSCYDRNSLIQNIQNLKRFYPSLSTNFESYVYNYYDFGNRNSLDLNNRVICDISNENDFYLIVISYISGMSDNFAIEVYNEIIGF